MSFLISLQYYGVLIMALISAVIATSNTFSLKKLIIPRTQLEEKMLISVLIPARNEEDKIVSCLQSLICQTYVNLEIIVLNDNSSDATAQIVHQFAKNDIRVRLINGEELPLGWVVKIGLVINYVLLLLVTIFFFWMQILYLKKILLNQQFRNRLIMMWICLL